MKRTTRHLSRLAVPVAVAGLVLTGCGDDGSVTVSGPLPEPTSEDPTSEDPTTPDPTTPDPTTPDPTTPDPTSEDPTSPDPTTPDPTTPDPTTGGSSLIPPAPIGGCLIIEDIETASIFEFPEIPCDEEHNGEVLHAFETSTTEFPGEDELFDEAIEVCDPMLEEYVGSDAYYSSLGLYVLYPTAETWEALSDRELICIVETLDGSMVTGTFEDWDN